MAFSLPSSSSASSSSPLKRSYDVFLSFRGIDTRNTFTAFLYHALCQRGIKTYINDNDLQRGETISPILLKAIEESMISIIVLSPNYASSAWCLEELTKILECKKTKQQIVLPVFYHVDPSDVRHLQGSFGEAFAKHQERFKEDPKVPRWKESLQEVAGLSGKNLEDGNEYEFMHKIIQWVDSIIVKSTYQLDIIEHPIGLESRLKDLNTNLEIGRNDITLMIGIYGTGGIGKSIIAKAVFNSIGHQFEARCFLANVREISSRKDGLGQLQEKLLYELLGNFESFNIGSVGGTDVIKRRLCSKRVLIILDDVNELCQLKQLAGNHNWFGSGSRIVITTRDQHLLTYHKVDSTYEVQGLDDNEAIQLFSWHAFKRDNPVESYVELTKGIIGYAKGLPLALTVLGSDLRGRSIQVWKSALEQYKRCLHEDIYEILKISYDGLDDDEKNIFLDIACFFKGKSVEYVTKILDSCGFSSSFGIARLQDTCLININHYECVELHDLLQEMGKEIVRKESPIEAGRRSRLWFHEDVRHVLEDNTGTNTIEGILLDFPEGDGEIHMHSEAFKEMKYLRLFINRNAQFSAGPNYLPNEIRVLDWPQYPSSFLPSNFHGNNLVEFRMPNGRIKELGGLKSKNLTVMDLRSCKFITKIPDLSSSPNLENLDLGDCENLVEVHPSVGFLDKLSSFSVSGCCKLRIFPKRFKWRSLRYLSLHNCSSLEDFPEIECEMEFLHELDFEGTSIKELPSSIENLKGPGKLNLYSSSLKKRPSSIGNLTRLEELDVRDCKNLVHLPNLENLDLGDCENLDLSKEVANLAGEHLEDSGRNEYEFMHKTIESVDSIVVKSTYQLNIIEHPIGLESRLKDLNTNLEIGRNDITLMIGIYGIGGIGKSIIAKAVFNSIGDQFEARCFLANVREISSRKDGLGQLQEKLLYELLGNFENFNIGSVGGTNVIKHRLCSKRVLLILDDVNELCQLQELAGNHNWFGPGSRIVITTRDQRLLTYHKVDSTYEVQGLDDNEAIQLFSWHAFARDKPVESYVELTKGIIGYAKGLPLALTVLGSDMRGGSIQEWKSALEKYKRCLHKDIYEILKISYDGLDDDEKNIFLDIACFFKGKSVEYVTKILDSCGFSSSFGIARLQDTCLINIGSQCVEMHDLLQEMGKEIVRQESPKEAHKRSRLWFHEEVRHVLEENTGTNTIEGILLDFSEGDGKIRMHTEAFKDMKNLRLFINRNAKFSAGPNYLPNEIRVLDWPQYPSSFLPSNFHGNNLVEFRMPNSRIKEFDGLKSKNLTVMDLRSCKFITKIPDLSSSPNLENLDLGDCENLVEVHHSIGFLDNLWSFSATGCCKLRIFPKRFKLRSLRVFNLTYCSSLEDFPEIECEMEFLHVLSLRGTSIKELPSSIVNLKGLEKLYLDRSRLKKIPSSIGNLTRLQELYAAGSASSAIWKSLQVSNFFPALVELDISGSDIVIFPAQSVRFASLRHLWLNNCKKLEEILPLPLSISTVQARECPSLESFALLSDILIKNNGTNFSNFLRIDLYGCHKLLANIMRPIPSWEERHSEEQNCPDHFEDRYIDIVFPGNRIPSWVSYRKEAHDSNLCEIDINRPHHSNDIDEIVLYVVLGFRVGITDPIMDDAYITVKIHDGSDWEDLYTRDMTFSWTDSDHVWMLWKSYGKEVDVSRFRFECDAEFVVFRRVGIHFLKKHEENVSP